MKGLKDAVWALRILARSKRLTPYEQDAVKYALAIIHDYFLE